MMKFKHVAAIAVLAAGIVSAGYAQAKAGRATKADSVNFEKPNEYKIFASKSPVMAFAVNKNTLWYATAGMVYEQPMNTKNMKEHKKADNIETNDTKSMAFDTRGNLWIACEAGVATYAGNKWTSYTEANGLPLTSAVAVAAAPNGDVWVGAEGGAARFSGGSWTKFTTAEGLGAGKVQAIVIDSKGNVYLGTDKGGLSVYDGSQFKVHTNKNTGKDGLEYNNVSVLAKEPNKDVIWMVNGYGSGLNNFNSFDGKNWKRFIEIQAGTTSIMNDTRRTWFGSESGLMRFNGEDWVDKPEQHGVPAEQVFAMFRDDNGNLWFGMEKGVLMLSNPYRK